jgi:DnaA-homolog protein
MGHKIGMNQLRQLALNLCLKDAATFANFFVGTNKQLINILKNLHKDNSPSFIYLWGNHGIGKSHLLSALCQSFSEHGLVAAYLPLEDAKQLDPQIFEDLEKLDLLCIDDLDLIAGNRLWEENVFHCFNKIIEYRKRIVITANAAPLALPLVLPDLKSRMSGGLVFEAHALSDEEKIAGLILRAKLRGLELTETVAQFLLYHYPRDTKSLFATLDQLDKAALTAQRKLTIPFVKNVLQDTNL